jgi:hypothetical protein
MIVLRGKLNGKQAQNPVGWRAGRSFSGRLAGCGEFPSLLSIGLSIGLLLGCES